jgi:hypothetical protein
MKTFINISILGVLLISAPSPCFAVLMLHEISSPEQCPEGLIIKSKVSNGMIEFDVTVDADKIANNEQVQVQVSLLTFDTDGLLE